MHLGDDSWHHLLLHYNRYLSLQSTTVSSQDSLIYSYRVCICVYVILFTWVQNEAITELQGLKQSFPEPPHMSTATSHYV